MNQTDAENHCKFANAILPRNMRLFTSSVLYKGERTFVFYLELLHEGGEVLCAEEIFQISQNRDFSAKFADWYQEFLKKQNLLIRDHFSTLVFHF